MDTPTLIKGAVVLAITAYIVMKPRTKRSQESFTEDSHTTRVATNMLRVICRRHNVDDSHGVGHALIVLRHAENAITSVMQKSPAAYDKWPVHRSLAIRLAALLHDADDHKYFAANSHNAADILDVVLAEHPNAYMIKKEALMMISFVSASSNGDNVPEEANVCPEFLIPRYADRLESSGLIGIKRCYDYSMERKRPLFNEDTPRPRDIAEIKRVATPERYKRYQQRKCSDTMMDHYYDKLIHVAAFNERIVQNEYLVNESYRRCIPIMNFCIEWGRTGKIDEEWIKRL